MAEDSVGIVDVIGAALLVYILVLMIQTLLPLLSGSEFGQQVISGALNAAVIVVISAAIYLAYERVR